MARSTSLRTIATLILVGVVVCNAWFFRGRLFSWITAVSSSVGSHLSMRDSRVAQLLALLTMRFDAMTVRRELDDARRDILAAKAREEALEGTIKNLRDAIVLRERYVQPLGVGSVFTYVRAGGRNEIIINRGSDDGVAVDDIVVTPHNELIGTIGAVYGHYAMVTALGDASFQVTAKIFQSEVAGLVRSTSPHKIILDLVQKDEAIVQGASLITSGDDRFPEGIVIGTVHSVDSEAVTLFQSIRVSPAVAPNVRGDVFILRP